MRIRRTQNRGRVRLQRVVGYGYPSRLLLLLMLASLLLAAAASMRAAQYRHAAFVRLPLTRERRWATLASSFASVASAPAPAPVPAAAGAAAAAAAATTARPPPSTAEMPPPLALDSDAGRALLQRAWGVESAADVRVVAADEWQRAAERHRYVGICEVVVVSLLDRST